MVEVPMVSEMGPVLLRVDLVPMGRSSVLSLLSWRKLWVSHDFTVEVQVSMWVRGGFWVGLVLIYIWVIGVTVEVQVECADDVTKGEEVADEEEGSED